jgi:acetyl esterase/lipase
VIICSPIGAEQVQNQPRELALADALATSGILVRRFHFRGAGDSDDDRGLTLDSMGEDSAATARQLIDSGEIDRVAFVGTRLAGLAAARAATSFDGAPLVLWEPVVQVADYFEEVFRYELVHELMHAQRGGRSETRSLRGDLERHGRADVLGFPVTRELYEGAVGHSLESELEGTPRPSLLVQVRRQSGVADEYAALASALEAKGIDLEVHRIRGNIPWWFLARGYDSRVDDRAIAEATVAWLKKRLALAG